MKIPGAVHNSELGITCNDLDCPERTGGMCHFDPRYQEQYPEVELEQATYENKDK